MAHIIECLLVSRDSPVCIILVVVMSPQPKVGDIVFGVDPIGVCVHVASFRRDIF